MKTEAVQETAQRTPDETVACLGYAYRLWKEYEADKNRYKDEFFAYADRKVEREGLALKLVTVDAPTHEKALERAQLHNPGWRLAESRQHPEFPGSYEVILEEDPAFQPFSYEHEGVKYARTVSLGPVMVDDEWLIEADDELFLATCHELPWGQVVVRPIESLDAQTIGRLSKYIYNGKPRVSLAPPRQVKEET